MMMDSPSSPSAKLESPSAERNKFPIWEQVFEDHLFKNALPITTVDDDSSCNGGGKDNDDKEDALMIRVLEVAAGSGVHTQFFGLQLANTTAKQPNLICVHWQSTDPESSALASQEAYIDEVCETCQQSQVQFGKPLPLTLQENGIVQAATDGAIAKHSVDWIFNINMIHISPWSATQGLMKMAATKLKPRTGRLILYGPYRVQGTTAESNVKFEEWLKAKDPVFGVRNLEDVVAEAAKHGLELETKIEMPANNLSVILRKQS